MLLFLTFRYGRNFAAWKTKQLQEIDFKVKMARKEDDQNTRGGQSSVAAGSHAQTNKSNVSSQMVSRHE